MRTRSILLWPFALLYGLLRVLFWPALVLVIAYLTLVVWLGQTGWFTLIAVILGFYTLFVVRIWGTVVRGSVRTMARGTVTVRRQQRRATRRGGGR